jgi:pyruvate/2-oxoacid:ferredoxin oxidoreductase beta subunit
MTKPRVKSRKSKDSKERENFERTITTLFKVSKTELAEKIKKEQQKGKD